MAGLKHSSLRMAKYNRIKLKLCLQRSSDLSSIQTEVCLVRLTFNNQGDTLANRRWYLVARNAEIRSHLLAGDVL